MPSVKSIAITTKCYHLKALCEPSTSLLHLSFKKSAQFHKKERENSTYDLSYRFGIKTNSFLLGWDSGLTAPINKWEKTDKNLKIGKEPLICNVWQYIVDKFI